ncbi:MAG: 5'-methylthioadenosine/S-adenosylhomocysteine nucleosidase [Bacteroidota bacterium]
MLPQVVILCPLEEEYNAVRNFLTKLAPMSIPKEVRGEEGYLEGTQIKLGLFEIGMRNSQARSVTEKILREIRPSHVFLSGIAGAIKDVEMEDIVVATGVDNYQSTRETKDASQARSQLITNPHKSLIRLAKEIKREVEREAHQVYFGKLVSGDSLIATKERATYALIKNSFSDALAVDMETHGFAEAFQDPEHRSTLYLAIRAISDGLDGKEDSDKHKPHRAKACRAAAYFTTKLIRRLPLASTEASADDGAGSEQAISAWYSPRLYPVFGWRRLDHGQLWLGKGTLRFEGQKHKIHLSNIRAIQRRKMPGDLRKSWIEVAYGDSADGRRAYFSDASWLGVGALLGASRQLLDQMREVCL